MLKKKILGQFSKNYRTFYPKKLLLSSQKYGFGIRYPGTEIRDPEKTYSRSWIQGSKRHRILDSNPQHCFLKLFLFIFCGSYDHIPSEISLRQSHESLIYLSTEWCMSSLWTLRPIREPSSFSLNLYTWPREAAAIGLEKYNKNIKHSKGIVENYCKFCLHNFETSPYLGPAWLDYLGVLFPYGRKIFYLILAERYLYDLFSFS